MESFIGNQLHRGAESTSPWLIYGTQSLKMIVELGNILIYNLFLKPSSLKKKKFWQWVITCIVSEGILCFSQHVVEDDLYLLITFCLYFSRIFLYPNPCLISAVLFLSFHIFIHFFIFGQLGLMKIFIKIIATSGCFWFLQKAGCNDKKQSIHFCKEFALKLGLTITFDKNLKYSTKGTDKNLLINLQSMNFNSTSASSEWQLIKNKKMKVITLFGKMKVLVTKNSKSKTSVNEEKIEKYHRKMLLISFSHQFNTPINGILSILPLLKEKLNDPKDIVQIDTAITSAKFLDTFVKNCIDYMSIKTNEFELRPKSFSITTMIAEVLKLISPHANRKGLKIHMEKDSRLRDEIFSDPGRLHQVLLTLLMNAVKYTNKGEIIIRVSQDQFEESLALFEVSDTGIGIPLDQRVQLFKLFGGAHQSNLSFSPNQRIGFGLTISNLLCGYLGRELSVQSVVGKGSTFSFYVKISNLKNIAKPALASSKSTRNLRDNISSLKKLRAKKHSILVNSELRKYCPIPTPILQEKFVETEGEAEYNDTLEFQKEKDIKEIKRFNSPKLVSFLHGKKNNSLHLKYCQYLNAQSETPRRIKKDLFFSPTQKSEFCDLQLKNNERAQFIPSQAIFRFNQLKDLQFKRGDSTEKMKKAQQNNKTEFDNFTKSNIYDSIKQFNHNCSCPLVLIVDDIEINKIALGGMVDRLGLSFIEASNGKEALDILKSQNAPKPCCNGIKIVFMDYDMPIMNGIESCNEIHKRIKAGKITSTFIVAVTAYEGASIEKECKEAGMVEYLKKPVPMKKLYDCIYNILSKKE